MTEKPLISRTDLLSGRISIERRAGKLLAQIEARCLHLRTEARRAIQAYFLRENDNAEVGFNRKFDLDYFQSLKTVFNSETVLAARDIERYVPQWANFVPIEPELRAELHERLEGKYTLTVESTPRTLSALGEEQENLPESIGTPLASPSEPQTTSLHALQEAVDSLEWLTIPDGAAIYRAGEAADAIYVLISGRVRVVVEEENAGQEISGRQVAELGRGELIGAIEVLTGEARVSTVIAIRDSELVRLPRRQLYHLGEKYPQVWVGFNRVLAERLRAQITGQERERSPLRSFALVPLYPGAPVEALARQLEDVLSDDGPTLRLDADRLDEQLGEGAAQASPQEASGARTAAWLNEQEAHYRYLLYQADPEPTEWTGRCLRQADRILLVAAADNDPEPGEMEDMIEAQALTASMELVLIHPEQAVRPSGTRYWLAPRPRLQGHYHLRAGRGQDTRYLARRLTSRALGLVLGGGGARGFAHIGAVRALTEAGLQPDFIGGSSMGAILGAAFAMGMGEDALLKIVKDLSSPLKLFDLTLPVVSFFSSDKVNMALQRIFGDTQIEDLWRPFFCLSSNLTRAVPMVHREGSLWLATRASSAIPGVFTPVLNENQELLVDGAVLNNLPVDVMEEISQGGPVVAINVFPEVDMDKEYDFGYSVSGWRFLLSRLNPLSDNVHAPVIFESLLRVIALNDVRQAKTKRKRVDLYLSPPVERFNILDFGAYAPIIEIGYEYTRQVLGEWQRDGQGSRLAACLPSEAALPVSPVQGLNQALAELEQALERLEEPV